MSALVTRQTTPDRTADAAADAIVATCVVVAYHRSRELGRVLAELAHPRLDAVVMNVEADPAVRRVAERAGARVVDLDGNPGYAAAVNRGVAVAGTDVVVFMNDDALIAGTDVLHLVQVVARGEAEVAVPRVVDDTGAIERTITAVPTPRTLAREWLLLPDEPVDGLRGRIRVEKWRAPDEPVRIDAAAAVVVAAPRALLEAEPLPEDYFLYWEESEWFWRLQRRGTVVQYHPEVTCVHAGGRGDVRPEKSRLLARNAVRCIRRTQGRRAAASAFFVVLAWNARLVVLDALRLVRRPGRAPRARLIARWAGLGAAGASWREVW